MYPIPVQTTRIWPLNVFGPLFLRSTKTLSARDIETGPMLMISRSDLVMPDEPPPGRGGCSVGVVVGVLVGVLVDTFTVGDEA